MAKTGIQEKNWRKYRKALKMRRKFSGSAIARKLGLSPRTVCLWLRRPRGEDKVRVLEKHLIKYHKALKLRRLQKLSGTAIARKLGLYPRTVSYWLRKEGL